MSYDTESVSALPESERIVFFAGGNSFKESQALIRAANSQLIRSGSVRINQLKTCRDRSIKKATTINGEQVNAITAKYDNLILKEKRYLNDVTESSQRCLQNVSRILREAEQRTDILKSRSVISPTATLSSLGISNHSLNLQRSPSQHLDAAEKLVQRAQLVLTEEIEKTKIPSNTYWMDDFGSGCGLLIGMFIFASLLASAAGFGGFLLGAGFIYILITILRFRIPAQTLVNSHEKVRLLLDLASAHANKAPSLAAEEVEQPIAEADAQLQKELEQARLRHENQLDEINDYFKVEMQGLHRQLLPSAINQSKQFSRLTQSAKYGSAPWDSDDWSNWDAPTTHELGASFGQLVSLTDNISDEFSDLPLPLKIPAFAPFECGQGLFFHAPDSHRLPASNAVQSLITRLLATIPPGKAFFTFIDPVGLGTQISPFMELAEYEKLLVNNQAWTEASHIEKKLAATTEIMETIIQKRLQGRYRTVHDYNQEAEVREPSRFIVVYDFPANFSDSSFRRLVSIARNGPKCGVYLVILHDSNKPLPYGCSIDELTPHFKVLHPGENGTLFYTEKPYALGKRNLWNVVCDTPPSLKVLTQIIKRTGELAQDGMRVEVPFDKLLQMAGLTEPDWLSPDRSTATGIQIPLGPTNDRYPQQLSLGSGTAHHGLIVGRTGSGKSNLLHVIISGLAWKYSPDELRLYLLDFKKGVEFEPYARFKLPHALAIAVESEREFAVSVIERLDAEMEKREPLFKDADVRNITDYRSKRPSKPLPRILLLIDEFQELFAYEDALSRKAALLLNRIVLQGRSFGLHVILATQTLKRAMELSTATFDQMAVRIALQCSDADSRLVLSDDNTAARILSRPGEAVYNDLAGQLEGNRSTFQVARFDDQVRPEWLKKITACVTSFYQGVEVPAPIVFDGRIQLTLDQCKPLRQALTQRSWPITTNSKSTDLLLGEPIAINPITTAQLRRQSGRNLLVICRSESDGVGMMVASAISLLISLAPGKIRLGFLNFARVDEPCAEYPEILAKCFPDRVQVWSRQRDLSAVLDELSSQAVGRSEGAPSSEVFVLFLIGLQRMKPLRDSGGSYENNSDSTPSENLRTLLKEGPESGIHTIAWCDSWSNARAHLDDRLHTEFSLRVAGMMNADDSRWFLDDDSASRLDNHRFLLYDEESPGKLDKFRGYALPSTEWIYSLAQALVNRSM